MTLETYADPADLYLARGGEVNPNRPLFTGDIFENVEIPGVADRGLAMIVAHPCSFRGGHGHLEDQVLVARILPKAKEGAGAYRSGHYDETPLPFLIGDGHWIGRLDLVGLCTVAELEASTRIGCLSVFGINLLQQRLTCHLTRAEIPTHLFHEAFAHTFEEAELLENWCDDLCSAGWARNDAAEEFERFIRSERPSYQQRLRDPQLRAAVRQACRKESKRLATGRP